MTTIRAWELNQRQPDRAAQNYLRVIEHEPDEKNGWPYAFVWYERAS